MGVQLYTTTNEGFQVKQNGTHEWSTHGPLFTRRTGV